MPVNGRMVCALVIGHKHLSPGAVNEDSGTTEFEFNDELARDIESRQGDVIIQRVYRRTYQSLPGDINELSPDFVVCLHCNAFNKRTAGSEVLYYHRSVKGQQMADILGKALAEGLKNRNRGIKPRSAEERGGYLLRYTNAPCVIAEPFFIDNNDELANAKTRRRYLVKAYLEAIEEIGEMFRSQLILAPDLLSGISSSVETVANASGSRSGIAPSTGWNSTLAHQVSIDHWARTYPEGLVGVLANPQVKDMSFFNAEVSPEVRRNEMRTVVGAFLFFHFRLGNPPQPGGISEDDTFNLLVAQFAQGQCKLSFSGDVVDACYQYPDELDVG